MSAVKSMPRCDSSPGRVTRRYRLRRCSTPCQILGDAPHRDLGALSVKRIAGSYGLSRLAIVNGKQADVRLAYLSRRAHAVLRMDDVPRIDERDWSRKVLHSPERKAEVLEVDRIALIDRELGLIGLHIAEVGLMAASRIMLSLRTALASPPRWPRRGARTQNGFSGSRVSSVRSFCPRR